MLQVVYRFSILGHEIPIYGYGLMLVVGFFACLWTGQWLGRKNGIDPKLFTDAVVLAIATGLIGARLCHVLENLPDFTRPDLTVWQNIANIFNTRQGGLTFYGGLLLATPVLILYARWHRVPVLVGMDIGAPLVMIGLGLGRIGCFLNGCCYGELCDLPWGVSFPYYSYAYTDQVDQGQIAPPPELTRLTAAGWTMIAPDSPEFKNDPKLAAIAATSRALPVHPTEIYSTITALLLAGLLITYMGLPHLNGRVFALMMMLEGFSRYVLELIRVEPAVCTLHYAGNSYHFSMGMLMGLQLMAGGIVFWILLGRYSSEHRAPAAVALPAQLAT